MRILLHTSGLRGACVCRNFMEALFGEWRCLRGVSDVAPHAGVLCIWTCQKHSQLFEWQDLDHPHHVHLFRLTFDMGIYRLTFDMGYVIYNNIPQKCEPILFSNYVGCTCWLCVFKCLCKDALVTLHWLHLFNYAPPPWVV